MKCEKDYLEDQIRDLRNQIQNIEIVMENCNEKRNLLYVQIDTHKCRLEEVVNQEVK